MENILERFSLSTILRIAIGSFLRRTWNKMSNDYLQVIFDLSLKEIILYAVLSPSVVFYFWFLYLSSYFPFYFLFMVIHSFLCFAMVVYTLIFVLIER